MGQQRYWKQKNYDQTLLHTSLTYRFVSDAQQHCLLASILKLFLSKQDLQSLAQKVVIPSKSPTGWWSANCLLQYSQASLWALLGIRNSLAAHWMCPLLRLPSEVFILCFYDVDICPLATGEEPLVYRPTAASLSANTSSFQLLLNELDSTQ